MRKLLMKVGLGIFLLFLGGSLLSAGQAKLTGIVHIGGVARALLELPGRSGFIIRPILRQGEATAGYVLNEIDASAGSIQLWDTNRQEGHSLRLPVESQEFRTFNFHEARLRQVLDVYQEATGRTVILSPELPDSTINWKSSPALTDESAGAALGEVISRTGITLRPVAEKFIFVLRESDEPRVQTLREPLGPAASDETFPPGLLRLTEADALQALDVYMELTGRAVIRPANLGGGKITVRSQTALTRSEAAWLVEAALLMARVSIVPESDSFAFALPTQQPVPRFDPESERAINAGELVPLKLLNANADQLLATYADLVGRKPLVDGAQSSRTFFNLRSPKPLTRAQAAFGLRALAELNGFKFESVGDDQIRLVSTPRSSGVH